MAKPPPNSGDPKKPKQTRFSWAEIIQLLIWISATAAAGFTLYLAIIARDTEKRQLRAYISIESANITKFGGAEPVEAHLIFKNSGQTPAYKVTAIVAIDMNDFPRKRSYSFEGFKPIQAPAVLGSGGMFHSYPFTKHSLTADETADVKNGSGAVYIWGEIHYRDVFDIPHFTNFRMNYGGLAGTRPDGLMQPTEGDNEAN